MLVDECPERQVPEVPGRGGGTDTQVQYRQTGKELYEPVATALAHRRDSEGHKRGEGDIPPVAHPYPALATDRRTGQPLRVREDRHRAEEHNDRRVPGYEPSAMEQLPCASVREPGTGRHGPDSGRHKAEHIPLAWRRVEPAERIGREHGHMEPTHRDAGHELP